GVGGRRVVVGVALRGRARPHPCRRVRPEGVRWSVLAVFL
ncbi:unnamed protein product, partial [Ectocarpus fasciculatus]